MADQEKVDERLKCRYNTVPAGEKRCGSEDNIHIVKGKSRTYGKDMETPICQRHVIDAHKNYNYETIEPWRPK